MCVIHSRGIGQYMRNEISDDLNRKLREYQLDMNPELNHSDSLIKQARRNFISTIHFLQNRGYEIDQDLWVFYIRLVNR